jgi:hypothetical protein
MSSEQTALRLLRKCYDELAFAQQVYAGVADENGKQGKKDIEQEYNEYFGATGLLIAQLGDELREAGYFLDAQGQTTPLEQEYREHEQEKEASDDE